MTSAQLAFALDKISERLGIATQAFDEYIFTDDGWAGQNASWHLELSFVQLVALAESLDLPQFRGDIANSLAEARKDGLLKGQSDPEGNPDMKWAGAARRYWAALHGNLGSDPERTVTKDLESILRGAAYSITDRVVFSGPLTSEAAVHARIEAILRCVFPDLVHKPRLGKPVKNFEPDTGIPSIRTLIEYKFLSSDSQVGPVADQLLADTQGYKSKDWDSFVYVIYETQRFRSEAQWRELLRSCGVDQSTTVVVLSGHPVRRRIKQAAIKALQPTIRARKKAKSKRRFRAARG